MAFRGSAVHASSSTTQTVTVSGISIQLNDIVLLCLSNFIGNTPSFPSGFAQVPGTSPGVNDGNIVTLLYWKLATGSEPSSYSITGVSFGGSLTCRVYSGRNTSSPFTTQQQTAHGSIAAFPVTFAITGLTAAAGDDVVVFVGEQISSASTAATLSYAADAAYGNAVLADDTVTVAGFWMASSDKVNTSGATGSIAGTLSVVSGAGPGQTGYLAQVVSLATAAPPPPSVPSRGPMPKQIYIMP